MPDPKKQAYYLANKQARLSYQRDYYRRVVKPRRARERELDELLSPEEWEAKVNKRRKYHRDYYLKNRDKIRAQRAAKRRERQRDQDSE